MSVTAEIVTSQITELAFSSQALTGSTVTVEAANGTQTTQARYAPRSVTRPRRSLRPA